MPAPPVPHAVRADAPRPPAAFVAGGRVTSAARPRSTRNPSLTRRTPLPSKARTAPPRRPPTVEAPAVIGDGEQPATGQPTPHDVADLINRGKLTIADGDALTAELEQRRLKHNRPAIFAVPIAMPVPADTRPAAAMAHLDSAVQGAVAVMTWTMVHDTDEYVIDAPQRPDREASRPSSAGGDVVLVRANVLLTVTVAAYVLHHFDDTVQQLLDEDLQHLRDAGAHTGPPRRAPAPREEDPDEDPRPGLAPSRRLGRAHLLRLLRLRRLSRQPRRRRGARRPGPGHLRALPALRRGRTLRRRPRRRAVHRPRHAVVSQPAHPRPFETTDTGRSERPN
jgi:hypothetical protein